ncbi:hypothetical protein [Aquitalea aquatilis]|uniref:hypothetical protein n=1 Tax=Aquitalea aquatilis TaxID=1537400 RepID=UPI0010BDC453|nr:hypothetical protein [Aquitalea aquatilis]
MKLVEAKELASNFTNETIQQLHEGVHKAFAVDAQTPPTSAAPYGIHSYADWQQWSDILEEELSKRAIPFTPVPWLKSGEA